MSAQGAPFESAKVCSHIFSQGPVNADVVAHSLNQLPGYIAKRFVTEYFDRAGVSILFNWKSFARA